MITFLKPEFIQKGWGSELVIFNNPIYCSKILAFNKDSTGSFHYHGKKTETWYIAKGKIKLLYFDLAKGNELQKILETGDIIHIPNLSPHQVTALEETVIFETSTMHFDEDTYRIRKGDSQK